MGAQFGSSENPLLVSMPALDFQHYARYDGYYLSTLSYSNDRAMRGWLRGVAMSASLGTLYSVSFRCMVMWY